MALTECGMHSGVFGLGWLFQILILIAFFLVVWWLLRTQKVCGRPEQRMEKPMDILKGRLAAGEITKKEYESLKKEIE